MHQCSYFKTHLLQLQRRLRSKAATENNNLRGPWPYRRCGFVPGQRLIHLMKPKHLCFADILTGRKEGCFSICRLQCTECVSVSSSGAGLQWTEPSGNYRHRVRGCPHHAALHGSGTADLEKVNIKAVAWNGEHGRCVTQTDSQWHQCEWRHGHTVLFPATRSSVVIPITVIHKCAMMAGE